MLKPVNLAADQINLGCQLQFDGQIFLYNHFGNGTECTDNPLFGLCRRMGIDMRCGQNFCDAQGSSLFYQLHAHFRRIRTVVDTEEYVCMQVNHHQDFSVGILHSQIDDVASFRRFKFKKSVR